MACQASAAVRKITVCRRSETLEGLRPTDVGSRTCWCVRSVPTRTQMGSDSADSAARCSKRRRSARNARSYLHRLLGLGHRPDLRPYRSQDLVRVDARARLTTAGLPAPPQRDRV